MPTPHQSSPLLLQSSSSTPLASRSPSALDPRPYLLVGQNRNAAPSAPRYPTLFPHEPEDARLTGATRSLYRRLLALNLPGRVPSSPVAVSATAGLADKSTFRGGGSRIA